MNMTKGCLDCDSLFEKLKALLKDEKEYRESIQKLDKLINGKNAYRGTLSRSNLDELETLVDSRTKEEARMHDIRKETRNVRAAIKQLGCHPKRIEE